MVAWYHLIKESNFDTWHPTSCGGELLELLAPRFLGVDHMDLGADGAGHMGMHLFIVCLVFIVIVGFWCL